MKIGGFLIVAAVALGACSGDPQPREPDPSVTPTSTATPPPMPEQATEDSPEGAAAFVDYWVDVSNYAAATGDVTELSRISSPDCSGCQSYIDLYRDTYEAGGYFKGGDWTPQNVEVETVNESQQVFVSISAPSGSHRKSAHSSEMPTVPEQSELIFRVTQSPKGSLTVDELERSAA